MELMSLMKTTNVLAEMELMSLMYQEQLMLLPYYYQQSQLSSLLQQQENYILSSLTPRQTLTESPPPPPLSSEEESFSQSEPLDLSLPPSLPERRGRARSPDCKCPLCGKQFSRPWLLKGKLER